MKAFYFEGESGDKLVEKDIPADLLNLAKEKKMELVAALGEIDPEIEEYYLNEDINVPVDKLKEAIRKNTINNKFCPVLMGSAYKNKGVQLLLDAVIDFLPNPTEVVNMAHDLNKQDA
jgi:elongation factor G